MHTHTCNTQILLKLFTYSSLFAVTFKKRHYFSYVSIRASFSIAVCQRQQSLTHNFQVTVYTTQSLRTAILIDLTSCSAVWAATTECRHIQRLADTHVKVSVFVHLRVLYMPVPGGREQWPKVIFTAFSYTINGGGLACQNSGPQEAVKTLAFLAKVWHTSAAILPVTLKSQFHYSGSIVVMADTATLVSQYY